MPDDLIPPEPVEGLFSEGQIPHVRDRETLETWSNGQDPRSIALPLSVAAAWTYSTPKVFHEVMQRRNLVSGAAESIEVVNDAMFVCAKARVQPIGKGAIVAFRGTEPTNVINWLADGSLASVPFHTKPENAGERGFVHDGFYRNTRVLWPLIVDQLRDLQPEWIYFTGHSYGGALAVLCAALLADYDEEKRPEFSWLWPRLRGVITFGQPCVGDAAFAKRYEKLFAGRLTRFVYDSDIVPQLPPSTPGWKPMHFGAEYRVNDARQWALAPHPTKPVSQLVLPTLIGITAWIKAQAGFAPRVMLPYSWGDHAPGNYVRISLPAGAESGSEFD